MAAVTGLIETFILIITPPDLFSVGLVAFVAAPYLFAETFTYEIVKTEKTPVEIVEILPDEKQKQALEFINLGLDLNCKTKYLTWHHTRALM